VQEPTDTFWAFNSVSEFLAMGKHGFYVWLAYGLTFLVLGILAAHSISGHARLRRELAAQGRRNEQVRRNAQTSSGEQQRG